MCQVKLQCLASLGIVGNVLHFASSKGRSEEGPAITDKLVSLLKVFDLARAWVMVIHGHHIKSPHMCVFLFLLDVDSLVARLLFLLVDWFN